MKGWINYHHLYYFKTIAEEGSVSGAAKKLRLGQPTLSAQLKQFEENLGVQLFERQHKKLLLSEQGKVALDYARSIFQMGNEMFEVLQDRMVPARLHVQIGALDSISKQIILQLTKAAYKIGPCNLSLVEGKSDEMIRELSAHRIDLFLTNFIPTTSDMRALDHRSLGKKNVSIYGAPKFKELRKGFPQSIHGQKAILPTFDSKMRHDFDHWLGLNKIGIDVVAETQDIALAKLMASAGLGLIPAAAHTVTRQVLSGNLIEIGAIQGMSEELFLISAKRKLENPISAKLMKTFSV